jgi:hypothetical protein
MGWFPGIPYLAWYLFVSALCSLPSADLSGACVYLRQGFGRQVASFPGEPIEDLLIG